MKKNVTSQLNFLMLVIIFLLNSTTSFLTAAIQTYASGAGITAAAGTRLALHIATL